MLRWLALLAAAGAAAIVPVCLAAAAVQAAVISLEGFGRALRASHQGDYATERGIEATVRYATKAVILRRKADELERRANWIEWRGSSAYEALLEERAAAKKRAQAEERERRRTLRAGPLRQRIFVGTYPEGLVYADIAVQVNGDFRPLAFLSYRTLELAFYDGCPHYLMPTVVEMAQPIIARAGERFQTSGCGHYVILGEGQK